MSPADRILRDWDLHAMVALDNFGPITQRIINLLNHGRRITLTDRDRFTHTDGPLTVTAGLTLDEVRTWDTSTEQSFEVRLKPGLLVGFALAAHAGVNDTERDEWRRFHAATRDRSYGSRRVSMTEVTITGGLPNSGPSRRDQLVIRHWNSDGVCTERVVAFDYGPDRQQVREDAGRRLWIADGRDGAGWDKLADAAWLLDRADYLATDGAADRERYLTTVDQVLNVAFGERERP